MCKRQTTESNKTARMRRAQNNQSQPETIVQSYWRESVMTKGQMSQARAPDWLNQRQIGRIVQAGSSVMLGISVASLSTLSITPHREPVHCLQPLLTHLLAKRNRFSGGRPSWAISTNSWSIVIRSLRKATRPSSWTTPRRMAPSWQVELGQSFPLVSVDIDN